MTQTRFHVTSDRASAERLFSALEVAFEEEGYPTAAFDTDEVKAIREVSL